MEVRALLDELAGTMSLVASLLYGTGMRLLEGLRLRVKDVEFERRELIMREGKGGKGGKDRVTVLPENLMLLLKDHLARVKVRHARDLADGLRKVWMPNSLAIKFPSRSQAWSWQ